MRREFLPEPGRHSFDSWIFEARNIVQVRVIQLVYQWLHRVADPRVIVDPTCLRIDFAFNRHFHFETVSMHLAAFVARRRFWQCLRGLKKEVLG